MAIIKKEVFTLEHIDLYMTMAEGSTRCIGDTVYMKHECGFFTQDVTIIVKERNVTPYNGENRRANRRVG